MAQPIATDGHKILIDIGRTRIRMAADQRSSLNPETVITIATPQFIEDAGAVYNIVQSSIERFGFDRNKLAINISLPTYIIGDRISFNDTLKTWEFSVSDLKQRLKVKSLRVINDMHALYLSIPLIQRAGHYRHIGKGVRRERAPILVVGVRSGVGALGLVVVRQEDGEEFMNPVGSEGGHIEVAPANDAEAEILAAMRARLGRAATASDVLSGEGSIDLYRCVASKYGIEPDPGLKAAGFKALTRATGPEADAARETISLWCSFLGSFVRNLALAFGAHGGVYIAGPVTRDFLAADETANRQVFRERFTAGGPGANYLISMPTSLITHPDPYLLGLSRFR